MFISSNSLMSDSFNFFKNQLRCLFILSFISAAISLILYYCLLPIDEIITIVNNMSNRNNSTSLLTWIKQLSNEEKMMLMKVSLLSLTTIFIGLILLISSVVTYLSELTIGNNISALQTLILSLRILPSMLILLIICAIIIYFGFMLFILPGIIFTIGFSLSPVILITNKNIMFLQAISQSWRIAFRYWDFILLILIIWLILQIVLTILLGQFRFLPGMVNNILSLTLNNLLTSFILIYFFRLYTLIINNKFKQIKIL